MADADAAPAKKRKLEVRLEPSAPPRPGGLPPRARGHGCRGFTGALAECMRNKTAVAAADEGGGPRWRRAGLSAGRGCGLVLTSLPLPQGDDSAQPTRSIARVDDRAEASERVPTTALAVPAAGSYDVTKLSSFEHVPQWCVCPPQSLAILEGKEGIPL